MSRDREFTWKKNLTFFVATSTALILTFFCKGMRSVKTEGFTLTAPDSVSVQRGLCVHIPCTFTYRGQPQIPAKELYAYWFKEKERDTYFWNSGLLVATNDEKQIVHSSASGRFRLTGDPARGDCSFSINNAASADQEMYYLRIEVGGSRFSYRIGYTRPRVNVTELTEKPEIRKSSELFLGEPVTITCQAPGSCSGTPPQISWDPYYYIDTISKPWQHPHSNGSSTYGLNATITPSKDNEGKVLTCGAIYSSAGEWTKTENTIRVDIAYPPATVHITVNVTSDGRLGSSLLKSKSDPDTVVALEDNTVSLLCQADSRPDPLLSWTKGDKTLNDPKQAKEHILPLSRIRAADAGLYRCQAENLLGSAAKAVRVMVQYAPKLIGEANATCWHDKNSFLCTCALHSWPAPQIQWQVEGETLSGNSSRGGLNVTSWLQGKRATSSLRLTPGSLADKHSVICIGNNSVGVYTMQFLLSPFRTESHTGILSELFGSETKGIVFLLGLYLIKACLCFLLFFFAFRFLNRRKTPPRKAPLTTSGL